MSSLVSSLVSLLSSLAERNSRPGCSKDNPMELLAVPGLMTLLDVALLRSVEGQLTATLTTSHALVAAWLQLQRQAVRLLQEIANRQESFQLPHQQARFLQMEQWARACLEAATDALHRMQTDPLAAAANLSDPYDFVASTTDRFGNTNDTPNLETGRKRFPWHQRPEDCWESPRLHCVDYVWAEDTWQACHRLLNQLHKHIFVVNEYNANSNSSVTSQPFRGISQERTPIDDSIALEQERHKLWLLLKTDLPTRLLQFRSAIEAEAAVTKRLYLIKCEYRAPFRAFLEAHHSVHRAPSLQVVEESLAASRQSNSKKWEQRKKNAKEKLQKVLATPVLVECLALEQRCAQFEGHMAQALHPFGDLARYLDHKGAQPSHALHAANLSDRLRRLQSLTASSGSKNSSSSMNNLRPLLLDLQGVPTDEEALMGYEQDESSDETELTLLLDDLETLTTLCARRGAFRVVGKKLDIEIPSSIVRGCNAQFDRKTFRNHYVDWRAMVKRQAELATELPALEERLRRAELQVSLAGASPESLQMVRQRLETLRSDRDTRLQVLQAMVEEVCLREMNLYVNLQAADLDKVWSLPKTSALGVFGMALKRAGEPLPIG